MSYLSALLLLEKENNPVVWSDVFGHLGALHVEIGFGHGEVIVDQAGRFSEKNFIGIERDAGRIVKTLKRIERASLTRENVRLLYIDAQVVFERFFMPHSIDEIACFFPCPWSKRKHWKNRLFSHKHLCLLNSRLKPDGTLRIVTDDYPYYEWILNESIGCGFEIVQNQLKPQFQTKFEKKWVKQGQQEFYEVVFIKKQHQEVAVAKGYDVKAYTIADFKPELFVFEALEDEQVIVFRSFHFDQKKQEAIVHLFVSEDNLEQHFLVMIRRVDDCWKIFKMNGQNIFQTKGIVRALELVYQAAGRAQ